MSLLKPFKPGNGTNAPGGGTGLAALRELGKSFGFPSIFGEDVFGDVPDLVPWPAMDVAEDDKGVTLRVDLPGMAAKEVDVEVSGNQLTVRGSREEESKEEKGGYRRHERRTGSFSRTVTLPPYVDTAKVDAKYDKGVLTVTAPKVPGAGPKRVTVKTS